MADDETQRQCGTCDGSGEVQVERAHDIADNPGVAECEEQRCGTCDGSGWVSGGSR